MKSIRKDIMDGSVTEIMVTWPQTIHVFLRHGMHCVGCQVGPFHTIEDACFEYHLDEAEFRRELERAINSAPQARPA